MNFKRIISALYAVLLFSATSLGYDHIILRNGQESDVKLFQINDEKIVYGYIGDRTNAKHEVLSKDVFMVYIEKQGNVYITAEGKRISGESERIDPKKNHVIYLVQGKEIGAEDVEISENYIKYTIKTKESGIAGLIGKSNLSVATLEKSDVFMIRYKSGMVDIITPFDASDKKDTISSEIQNPQYVVLFHSVSKGETLESIALKYNVDSNDIKGWNDLPARIKNNTPLTVGMQLMIYQLKK